MESISVAFPSGGGGAKTSTSVPLLGQVQPPSQRVRTMTVEEGHVINIDGSSTNNPNTMTNNASSSGAAASSSKYKQVPTTAGSANADRALSGVGRNALFATNGSDAEDGGGNSPINGNGVDTERPKNAANDRVEQDRISNASGASKTTSELEAIAKLPWYRGVTCKDVRDIMPTLLILFVGLLVMIFVIPYAFSSVIKQLEAEHVIEAFRKERGRVSKNGSEALNTTAEEQTTASLFELDGADETEEGTG